MILDKPRGPYTDPETITLARIEVLCGLVRQHQPEPDLEPPPKACTAENCTHLDVLQEEVKKYCQAIRSLPYLMYQENSSNRIRKYFVMGYLATLLDESKGPAHDFTVDGSMAHVSAQDRVWHALSECTRQARAVSEICSEL